MIFKSDIIDAINDMNDDLSHVFSKLKELDRRVTILEPKPVKKVEKKKPGRPRKNK